MFRWTKKCDCHSTPGHVLSILDCYPATCLQDDDGVLYQILVLHDDQYVRTYTVSEKEFEVVKDKGKIDQSSAPKFRGTECIIDATHKAISDGKLQKV